jgi:hypothetical protein
MKKSKLLCFAGILVLLIAAMPVMSASADDPIQTIKVNFTGVTVGNVWIRQAGTNTDVVPPLGSQTNSVTANVPYGTYDVWAQQGSGPYEKVFNVDCNEGGACTADYVIANLTVNFPDVTVGNVLVRAPGTNSDVIPWSGTQTGSYGPVSLLADKYDIWAQQGNGKWEIISADCAGGGDCEATYSVANLTVNFAGVTVGNVLVRVPGTNSDVLPWSGAQTGSYGPVKLLADTYDIWAQQGNGKWEIISADCSGGGDCAATYTIASMTVNFPGVTVGNIWIRQSGGTNNDVVTPLGSKTNVAGPVNLLADTYDVWVQQGSGAYEKKLSVDCTTGGACNADFTVKTLTINFPGVTVGNIWIRTPGTNSDVVTPLGAQTNSAATNVLADNYDVWVQQGGGAYEKKLNVDCTASGPCTANYGVATLTVPFAGFSGVDVWVRVPDGSAGTANGGTAIQASGQADQAVFKMLQAFYDVIMRVNGKYYVYDNIDCTGATCTTKPTLTVNFPGISGVHTYIKKSDGVTGSAGGADVANQTYKNDLAVFTTLVPGKYDVVVVQGAMRKVIDDVMVFGSSVSVDNIVATLTIKFPGISGVHTYVKTTDGIAGSFTGGDVTNTTYKNDTTSMNVLKGVYDVKVVQGAQGNIYDELDCSSGVCVIDNIVATLAVDFPGISGVHTYVKTTDGNPVAFGGGDVANTTYKNDNTSMKVLKGTYDVKVVQGAQQNLYEPVDCTSGTCSITDIVATLTVDFPGISGVHTYVKTLDGNPTAFGGGDVTNTTYKNNTTSMTVLKGIYDVKVVQGAQQNLYEPIDCTSGACSITDIVETLTVDFPGIGGVHAYVKTLSGGDVNNRTYQNNSTSLVVLEGNYRVVIVKGAQQKTVEPVDCTTTVTCLVNNIVATLTVKFPGMSGIHLYIKADDNIVNSAIGGDVDNRTYQNNETTLAVLKAFYDVKLVKGSDSYIYDGVDCTGNTCTLDKANLTVKFLGISSVHTYVKKSDGAVGVANGVQVASQTWKTDFASFPNLPNGMYDVVVVKGAKTRIIDNVTVLGGWATVDKIVATLTVKFPGISSVHAYVKMPDGVANKATGGAVDERTWKTDETSLAVLKGTYDAIIVKGARQKIVDTVDCNSDTCTVSGIVATLTVNFPGISSVHSYVKVDDTVTGTAAGGAVDERTWKTDSTSLAVLKGTYDVIVVKGAKQLVVDAVDCTLDTCSVNDIVATLTVNFPDISSVHTYVKIDNGIPDTATGGAVDERTWKTDTTSLAVLKGFYDVAVVKGAQTKVIDAVDCRSNTCTVDDIVTTLTVNFPGISSVHSYVKVNDSTANTAGGGAVDERTWKTDAASIAVLKASYDVVVVKGAKQLIVDAVDCTAGPCEVNDIIATLTVKFPGISSVHTYVKLDDNVAGTITGGSVDERTWKNNETSLAVLKGTYDIAVVKGAKTKVVDKVNCTSSTCVVDNIVATMTINFPGLSSVHTYVKTDDNTSNSATGGAVDERTWKTNSTSLVVLKNTYDVVIVAGGTTTILDSVNCYGNTCEKTLVTVKLLNSTGGGLAGGAFDYRFGWGPYTLIGTTDASGVIRFAVDGSPVATKIRVTYKGAVVEKEQNVATHPTFVFQTTPVTALLKNSVGSALGGAIFEYRYAWGAYTPLTGPTELLPVSTKVRITYKGTSMEKEQDVKTTPGFEFQTTPVTAQLLASDGTTDLSGSATFDYRYAWGAYTPLTGPTELLPVSTKVRVTYKGASMEKEQDVKTTPGFEFQTTPVTAQLLASDGTTDLSGSATFEYRYGWGAYTPLTGPTELLPVSTKVKVNYAGTSVEKELSAKTFIFQTGSVTSPTCTKYRYAWESYMSFTSPMELLSVLTKFSDANGPETSMTPISGGTIVVTCP